MVAWPNGKALDYDYRYWNQEIAGSIPAAINIFSIFSAGTDRLLCVCSGGLARDGRDKILRGTYRDMIKTGLARF